MHDLFSSGLVTFRNAGNGDITAHPATHECWEVLMPKAGWCMPAASSCCSTSWNKLASCIYLEPVFQRQLDATRNSVVRIQKNMITTWASQETALAILDRKTKKHSPRMVWSAAS
jgi:hypothetical protein